VALIVIGTAPIVAEVVADSFIWVVPAPGAASVAGVKLAVTPVGRPVTENATAELKPPTTVVWTWTVVVPPSFRVAAVAAGLTVKFGTESAKLAVLVTPPPVPVTVKVYDPPVAVVPAVNCRMAAPEPGATMVAVEAVTPAGKPATERLTAELKVEMRKVVATMLALAPGATLIEVGLRLSVKLGAGCTSMASDAALVTPPPVAEMVNR
jgi:hypothetical protein